MTDAIQSPSRTPTAVFEACAEPPADIRPLGPLEHLFWLMDRHRPLHFTVTAHIDRKPSPAEWRRALDRVQQRHPLLSACIQTVAGGPPVFRRVPGRPIPLRIVSGHPDSRWKTEAAREMGLPFATEQGPLVRAVVIEGGDDAALVLAAHHSAADGLSVACLIRDILRVVAGETIDPLPVPGAQEDFLERIQSPADPAEPEGNGQAASPPKPVTYRANDGASPAVYAVRFTPDFTAELRKRARQEGTTMHGALCAAYVFGGRQVAADWRHIPIRILSPLETRTMFGAGEGVALFITAVTHSFETQPKAFWDVARFASSSVATGKSPRSIAALLAGVRQVMSGGLDIAAAAEFATYAFASEVIITNLGAVSIAEGIGPLKLKAFWGPSVLSGFEGQQSIGVATLHGALALTHTSHTPPDGLLEAMHASLIQACAS